MSKENNDFVIKTCEEIRLWKSKGLTTTQSDILAYRLRIMKSAKFTRWNITNKKMAELFDVSERTVERVWEDAINVGLLPDDADTGDGMDADSPVGNADTGDGMDADSPVGNADTGDGMDADTGDGNADTGVGLTRQPCRIEEPIFIGETDPLSNIKGNIKETNKGNIKEASKPKINLTEPLKKSVIIYARLKLGMIPDIVYNKSKMKSGFIYCQNSKESNDWVGLSKTDFTFAYKTWKKEIN